MLRSIQKADRKGFKMYADREGAVPHLETKCILTRRYELASLLSSGLVARPRIYCLLLYTLLVYLARRTVYSSTWYLLGHLIRENSPN